MAKFGEFCLKVIIVLMVNLLFAAIGLFMYNSIVVPVFSLPSLTYWQFYGIKILIDCLKPIHLSEIEGKK